MCISIENNTQNEKKETSFNTDDSMTDPIDKKSHNYQLFCISILDCISIRTFVKKKKDLIRIV